MYEELNRKGHMRICVECAEKIDWRDQFVSEPKRAATCDGCGIPGRQTVDIEEGRYQALKERAEADGEEGE